MKGGKEAEKIKKMEKKILRRQLDWKTKENKERLARRVKGRWYVG